MTFRDELGTTWLHGAIAANPLRLPLFAMFRLGRYRPPIKACCISSTISK